MLQLLEMRAKLRPPPGMIKRLPRLIDSPSACWCDNGCILDHKPCQPAKCFTQQFDGGSCAGKIKVCIWGVKVRNDLAERLMQRDEKMQLSSSVPDNLWGIEDVAEEVGKEVAALQALAEDPNEADDRRCYVHGFQAHMKGVGGRGFNAVFVREESAKTFEVEVVRKAEVGGRSCCGSAE
jgi:hypothetical protein